MTTSVSFSASLSTMSVGGGEAPIATPSGRYEPMARVAFDDGWRTLDELPPFKTTVTVDATRKIITRNELARHWLRPLDQSLSRLRAWLHLLLRASDPRLSRPVARARFRVQAVGEAGRGRAAGKGTVGAGYEPKVIAIGTNTDPYQPIERRYKVMRRILEVLDRAGHPVGIVTKSALVLRDLDILARMAERNLAKVALSVTTLDPMLARKMEPRAATPMRRLETMRRLSAGRRSDDRDGGADHPRAERHGDRAHPRSGANCRREEAGYVLLRLPLEVRDLFREWLMANYPDRYRHVFKLIRDMRGGKDYDSTWGKRHEAARALMPG